MYYKSNALYEYIRKNNIDKFEFVSGNLWQLVYGDGACIPRLLVVASGVNSTQISVGVMNSERVAYSRILQLSCLTGVPAVFIRFCIDKEVDSVYLYTSNGTFQKKTMFELTTIYSDYGLPINASSTAKYLNDKESSAYHKWQRASLGSQLKVSDIDLLKINLISNSIEVIYELKRSFISIEKWAPYTDDYNNFRLLGNLLTRTGIPLKIAYNVRTTKPWNDNINTIKIFNVNVNNTHLISFDKTVSLTDFING